ncbi:MAG: hypothetical protein ACXWFS_10810 [Thermoanaerobaculia bacterium]
MRTTSGRFGFAFAWRRELMVPRRAEAGAHKEVAGWVFPPCGGRDGFAARHPP